ncbi:uncharacterized protein LOC119724965 [Patiria miniata]|uniref:TNFR-Cys domain-containing protein n=1 Tax=Patiria miniata TaxID=46514 RepID=A0A913ZK93_PATMI|nr:uncharacterized protein LOC119724965 [Patiria miniata]
MKQSSPDFLMRESHTCLTVAHEDLTTMHSNHKQSCRTFFPIRSRDVLLILIFVSFLHVQSANATRPEYRCIEGERLPRFDGCNCGEYASIVSKEEARQLDEAGVRVFSRPHGRKPGRQQSYVCIQCTRCGDGIKVDSPCTSRADTECSNSACADPSWKFDFGSKSCKPPSTPQPQTSTVLGPTIARTPARVPFLHALTRTPPPDDKDDVTHDPVLWSQKQSQLIIIGVVAVVTVLLILLVAIMIMVIQMKGKIEKIASSPYSSQNTSNSSVNV